MTSYSDVAYFGAPLSTVLNASLNSTLNATLNDTSAAIDLPLFIATWNPLVLIFHLLNHPKIKVCPSPSSYRTPPYSTVCISN